MPAGITVNLVDSNDAVVATVETNAQGQYEFSNVAVGDYTIQVDTSDTEIPANLTLGTDNNLPITVSDGDLGAQNFGFDLADNPAEALDNSYTTKEDISINGNVLTDDDNGIDSGDTPLTIISNTEPSNGSVTVAPDGSFSYTSNVNFVGEDSFTYTIEDANGDTDTATVSLNVTPLNDPPVNTVPTEQTTTELVAGFEALVFSTANDNAISISDLEVDPASDIVEVTLTAIKGAVTLSTIDNLSITNGTDSSETITVRGTVNDINTALEGLTYNPTAAGSGSITINTNDLGIAGTDFSELGIPDTGDDDNEQDTDIVRIKIDKLVDVPTDALDDSYTTQEEVAVTGNVLTDDNGEDAGDSPLEVIGNTEPSNGSIAIDTEGNFTYTPDPDFVGEDSFTYTIQDVDGQTDTATVTIAVEPINDAPVNTVPVDRTVSEIAPIVFNTNNGNAFAIADLDAGDADVEITLTATNGNLTALGNTDNLTSVSGLNTTTVNLKGAATDINLALEGLTYTPDGEGVGTIEIKTNDLGNTGVDPSILNLPATGDADNEQDTDTVTITVDPTTNAVDNSYLTNENLDVSGNLISDDTGAGVDIGNAPITIIDHTEPNNGSVTLESNGDFTYSPTPGFAGENSFTYTIEDGGGDTDTATVFLTVNPINDAPVNTVPTAQTSDELTSVVFSTANGNAISIADPDADGSNLRVTLTSVNGTITDLGDFSGLSAAECQGEDVVILEGSQSAINTVLEGLTYTPNDGGVGSIEIQTSDLGHTGADPSTLNLPATGGDENEQDTDTVEILIDAIADNPGKITGRVWNDLNLDGIQDGDEVGLENMLVSLYRKEHDKLEFCNDASDSNASTPVATAITNSDGTYEFTADPDLYYVEFTIADNAVFSPKQEGDDPNVDSDVFNYVTGTTQDIALYPGETIDLDAGISPDSDGDTIPDAVEGTEGDRDNDGILNYLDVDPAGYFYEQNSGTVLSGGLIDVSGPGLVDIRSDANADGFYQWFIDGTAGIYTMDITPPDGYILSPNRLPLTPALDATPLTPDPFEMGESKDETTGKLFSADFADNPYYLEFELASGDPFIINNNIPLVAPPTLDLDGDNNLTGNDYETSYVVGGSPVAIADDVLIGDLDDTNLQSASIYLKTRPDGDGAESLVVNGTLPAGINAVAFDPVTGTLELNGEAPISDYQTAIAQIEYTNSIGFKAGDRLVEVTVNDGISDSNIALTTIDVDFPPYIDLDGNDSSFV